MPIRGGYLIAAGGGALLLWSGLRGKSLSASLRDVISGKSPATLTAAYPIVTSPNANASGGGGIPSGGGGGDTGAHGTSARANQATAKLSVLIGHPSWAVGQQWSDWVKLWNQESGWNNLAKNPSSGAFGIAQALGHGGNGTAGKYGNEYPSKAANDGNALAQIQWGIGYIAQRYGSPSAAWAHEQSAGWY
jgi:resuscitation-promoting factor RpfB